LIQITVLDDSGDTVTKPDMTIGELEALFALHTAPRSKGGYGRIAAIGGSLDTLEHVRTWGEVAEAHAADPAALLKVTVVPTLQGG
jgi:hypothetical protein